MHKLTAAGAELALEKSGAYTQHTLDAPSVDRVLCTAVQDMRCAVDKVECWPGLPPQKTSV